MQGKLKECMKPHALAHSLTGFGVGLIVVNLVSSLYGQMGLWLGVILLVAGFAWDWMVNKG